jgi:hypothetical protein
MHAVKFAVRARAPPPAMYRMWPPGRRAHAAAAAMCLHLLTS